MKRIIGLLKKGGILMSLPGMLGAAEKPLKPYEAADVGLAESRIDRLVFDALRKEGFEPARPCSDEVFVRRVFLDVTGMLPETREVETFLHDRSRDKRARLIDDLLARDA